MRFPPRTGSKPSIAREGDTKWILPTKLLGLKSMSERNSKGRSAGRKPFALFLSKYGEQETGIFDEPDDAELDETDQFFDEAMCRPKPSFDVCTVREGRLIDNFGNPISLDDLPRLIKEAEDERVRFYREREKEFGPSAWPRGSRQRFPDEAA